MENENVRITGIADLTAWVQGLGKGLIIAPEYNMEACNNITACAGDCNACNLCNGEGIE